MCPADTSARRTTGSWGVLIVHRINPRLTFGHDARHKIVIAEVGFSGGDDLAIHVAGRQSDDRASANRRSHASSSEPIVTSLLTNCRVADQRSAGGPHRRRRTERGRRSGSGRPRSPCRQEGYRLPDLIELRSTCSSQSRRSGGLPVPLSPVPASDTPATRSRRGGRRTVRTARGPKAGRRSRSAAREYRRRPPRHAVRGRPPSPTDWL